MKTIANRTRKPLRIRLPGGKTLHLGPAKTGQISDQAAEEESIRKRVERGEIEIVGEAAHAQGGAEAGGPVQEATHGHRQTTVVLPKGNR